MPANENLPATDSATDLHRILGDDATATFEDDPNFVESNPTGKASSENVEEQRSAAGSTLAAKSADDTEDDDDEEEDVDEDEDLDEEDDEDDDLDDEDDDEDDLDDDTEDDDDVDDEDEEDDADEVKASSVLRADGLLGYEDEAEDVKNGVDRKKGDANRAEAEEKLKDGEKSYDPLNHEDGKWEPKERDDTPEAEGALIEDRNDASNFVPPYRAAAPSMSEGAAFHTV